MRIIALVLALGLAGCATVVAGGGGGGACPGGDSGFVPAGYSCVTALEDEFPCCSVNSTRWGTSGTPDGVVVDNDGVHILINWNGSGYSGGGIHGITNVPIPDAPSYIEFRARFNPYNVSGTIVQLWTCGHGSPGCNPRDDATSGNISEETDIDMGYQCGSNFGNGNSIAQCTTLQV